MLTDARSLPPDDIVEADVCIVGAGPAGVTVALELAERDLRVCLLESGETDPRAQDLAAGETAGEHHYRLDRTRARAFGGTSRRWASPRGVRSRGLTAVDFEARPPVPHSGWPFGLDHLAPYYERVHELFRLGPYDYRAETWADPESRPVLPLPDDLVTTTVFQFAPQAGFARHLSRLATSPTVRLLVHATALELLPDELGSRVDAVRVAADPGREFTVRATVVVVAGGGIENARLLRLSNRRHPAGLGNGHDLVGRHFMEHPHMRTGVVRPVAPTLPERLGLYRVHEVGGVRILAKLTPSEDLVRREGLLNSAWWVFPRHELVASDVGRAIVELRDIPTRRRLPPHTLTRLRTVTTHPATALATLRHGRRAEEADGRPALQLAVMAEQAPNPASRVTLGRGRDRFGQPVPRLDWRLTELDRQSIRRTQGVLDRAFQRAGIGRLVNKLGDEHPPAQLGVGFHHMGTTRMHPDPRHGVVDADCRVHGVANLYMAGSSVFPTSGYANPTVSLVALALRLAEHVGREMAGTVELSSPAPGL